MRKEKIWISIHPEDSRVFVQATPVSVSRGRVLRAEGYTIYVAEVTFPPIEDQATAVTATANAPKEQRSQHDAPDATNSSVELSTE